MKRGLLLTCYRNAVLEKMGGTSVQEQTDDCEHEQLRMIKKNFTICRLYSLCEQTRNSFGIQMAPQKQSNPETDPGTIAGKKTFNKKEWRQKQYSTKWKVQKFEEEKRKAAIQKYHKELKKEKIQLPQSKPNTSRNEKEERLSAYQLAQKEYEKVKEEQKKQREAAIKRKQEMKEALNKYKQKKTEKYKKLSKKTKKGQPVMKYRLEMLLEKIEKNYKS
nr:PREDICTED: rRNA-processing protein FYV7 isoform X1 [Bemisia tabaci]